MPVADPGLAGRTRRAADLLAPALGGEGVDRGQDLALGLAFVLAAAARPDCAYGPDLGPGQRDVLELLSACEEPGRPLEARRGRSVLGLLDRLTPGVDPSAVPHDVLVGAAAILFGPDGSVAEVSPTSLASSYERLVADGDGTSPGRGRRREIGAFYTPELLVDHLLETALRGEQPGSTRLLDPACGAGNFLLGTVRHFQSARRAGDRRPVDPRRIARSIHGIDSDPGAVHACRLALWLQTGGGWEVYATLTDQIRVADSVLSVGPARPGAGGQLSMSEQPSQEDRLFVDVFDENGGFDVVIGNPPFLNQLAIQTASSRSYAERLRRRFGDSAQGYADLASVFLVLAVEIARPDGGRIALVQPDSLLSARDARAARRRVLELASITSFWVALERVFDAGVLTCAPTLTRGGARRVTPRRFRGLRFEALPEIELDMDQLMDAPTWGALVADALGVPPVTLPETTTLGEHATATADFRDQYYGLRAFVHECSVRGPTDRERRLVTSGLIDPLRLLWGSKGARFNKVRFDAPVVDLEMLGDQDPSLHAWALLRLVPKLLLATQTRVLEVVADPEGFLVPSVPVVTVVPNEGRLWHVLAALSSPVVSAFAMTRYHGAALSADAIKLSAAQVEDLPVPRDRPRWDEAARLAEEISEVGDDRLLRAFGTVSSLAFGQDDPAIVEWWLDRLPKHRPPAHNPSTRFSNGLADEF